MEYGANCISFKASKTLMNLFSQLPRQKSAFRTMDSYGRQILLLLIFVAPFGYVTHAQKVSKRYFIGRWQSVDSSTGLTEKIIFTRKRVIFFSKSDTTKWKYSIYDKDTIVEIKYVIYSKWVTLEDEGVLVILNNTSFWWFNPLDYDKYIKLQHNGYSVTHKEEFETWLKGSRLVVYRR